MSSSKLSVLACQKHHSALHSSSRVTPTIIESCVQSELCVCIRVNDADLYKKKKKKKKKKTFLLKNTKMRTNRIRREGSTPHEALIITLGSACRIRTDSSRGAKPLTENDKLLRWHHMCHFIAKRNALTGYSTSKDQGMNGTQSHDGQLLIKLNSIIRITQLFYAIFRCGTHKIP